MGREITFNKDVVIGICLNAFWKNGFDNTSIRELQKLTGLSGRSLIHSFGDKRQIFDLCLQHYLVFVEQVTEELAAEPKGIEIFFEHFTECDISDVRQNGCFVLNSIYGSLRADQELIKAFEHFSEKLTCFFIRQLTLKGIRQPTEKANILFDMLLAGLTKISIYKDATRMKDEFNRVNCLIRLWLTE